MPPQSPSNPGGQPLPPRKPKDPIGPSGDTSERDLWDLEDTEETAPQPEPASETEDAPATPDVEPPPAETPTKISPAPRGSTPRREKSGPSRQTIRKMEDAFEDLEDPGDWDVPATPPSPEEKPLPEAPAPAPEAKAETIPAPAEEPATPREKNPEPPAPTRQPALSTLERAGLGVLILLLLGVGIFFYTQSLNRLPQGQAYASEADFPIRGERVEIVKATSHWRAPVTSGPQADVVRRGTRLIPVVELQVKGSGALRVFFRDDTGSLVGDGVSLSISGDELLKIAATAGFDDPGLYAAYRTGEGKPWTVEVFEGSSVNATRAELKMLFEMPLSSVRK